MKKNKTLKLIIAGAIITCTILTVTGCGKKTNEVTEYNKENDVSINKNVEENKNNLNQNITNNSATSNISENKVSENNTYNALKGYYKVNGKFEDVVGEARLNLCENGCFAYYYYPETDEHYEGYYTIDGDAISLHCILDCSNDPGAIIINKTIKLKINSDNSISDNELLKTTLNKASNNPVYDINISESISSRFNNKFLNTSESLNK